MPNFNQMPEVALEWLTGGRKVALATVVGTWGSSPRPTGSQLVISEGGTFEGSVSGGCVEGAVVLEAQDAISDGRCRVLEYGVSDDDAFATGLACGGTIRVIVEPIGVGNGLSHELLSRLVAARAARKAVAYEVDLTDWSRRMLCAGDDDMSVEISRRFRADQSGMDGERFVGIHNPPLRMLIIGAVHIAQPLIPMARLAGYDIWLIDPRGAFAASSRFPDVEVAQDWPDEVVAALKPDARTAVVTLSHDPKIDDPAILEALKSNAFYIGCLGSNRTHAKRLERLQDAGLSPDDLARIKGPVGLNIGARSPAEIAISIMAEITERLRNGTP